jgi:hypothetical protein
MIILTFANHILKFWLYLKICSTFSWGHAPILELKIECLLWLTTIKKMAALFGDALSQKVVYMGSL